MTARSSIDTLSSHFLLVSFNLQYYLPTLHAPYPDFNNPDDKEKKRGRKKRKACMKPSSLRAHPPNPPIYPQFYITHSSSSSSSFPVLSPPFLPPFYLSHSAHPTKKTLITISFSNLADRIVSYRIALEKSSFSAPKYPHSEES